MKICFVGLGSIGRRHLNNIISILKERKIDYTIDALRSNFSKEYDKISIINNEYYSIDELPSDYDIIFITNPTCLHYQTIEDVINKTKHMFIEKPLFESCIHNIQNIMNFQGVYYVASPLRYSSTIKYVKDIISHEKIYSIRAVSSSYLPEWRKGVDYRDVYSAKKDLGGGVSLDLIHEWDYITYLFGMPEIVYNINGKYSDLDIDSDDISIYIAKYVNKVVEVHIDYIGRDKKRILELYCKDYVIYVDIINNTVEYKGKDNRYITLKSEDMYINEMNYFVDNILSDNKVNHINHAYQVLKIALGEYNN